MRAEQPARCSVQLQNLGVRLAPKTGFHLLGKSCSLDLLCVLHVICLFVISVISYFCSEGRILDLIVPNPGHCLYMPRHEKTGLRGFRPGLTQTRMYSHIRWLEA